MHANNVRWRRERLKKPALPAMRARGTRAVGEWAFG
jgi:hypothetical protein